MTSSAVAHAGERSCRVCARADEAVYGLEQSASVEQLTPGITYTASAWLRAGDDPERAESADVRIGIELDRGPHTSPLDGSEQPVGSLTTSWMLVSKSFTYEPIEGATT